MKRKFLLSLMVAVLFATGIGTAFGAVAGAGAFALTCINKRLPSGSAMAGVIPEIWCDYVIGNLFKNNEFLLQSVDESQYVIGGSCVHIPQAGGVSGVKRNRTALPATITRRKDIDVTYPLDELTTDPRFIANIDKAELSYDLMDSCMSEDMSALQQFAAESMLYNWRPTFFIKTTGDATAAHIGSGYRKGVSLQDFITAKSLFNKWNIAKADRYCILDTEMFAQLCTDLKATNFRDYSAVYNPVTGELNALEGFKIYERSTALNASNNLLTQVKNKSYFNWTGNDLTYTPEAFIDIETGETAAPATSCAYALFWSKTWVARAMGATKMFDNQGNPQYYGDIYSFLQRIGGRSRRADGYGVLGLIQDTATAPVAS
jgi:hypothetical protein